MDTTDAHQEQYRQPSANERKGMSRRRLLTGGAGVTAALFAAHATGDFRILREASAKGQLPQSSNVPYTARHIQDFDDSPIDPEAVVSGEAGWFPTIYGEGDQLGTLNEITPKKVFQATRLVLPHSKVYNMGEIMEPGMPAFPGREYVQERVGPSEEPPPGDNAIIGMEERFATTYQIATQIDGLPHIGVGTGDSGLDPNGVWYNGWRTSDVVGDPPNPHGAEVMGQHLVDPFITRGVLLDVLSVKIEQGASDALGEPVNGNPILANDYRITLEDLEAAMQFGGIKRILPGDMVTIRTGWTHLFSTEDPDRARYLASEPGPYLREARWLAQFRPAVVASDTWAWEVLPTPDPGQFFPVHQVLLTQHGIRIGEAFVSEDLAEDGVYEFLFFYTGQRAKWATAANVAPGAVGTPGKKRGRGRPSH